MTPKLLEIFSNKKRKNTIKQNKISKVIIDYREKNSLVPTNLLRLELEIEFKELKAADYIINGVAIERKTISDFISSMINKRLLKQLKDLQQYKNKLLLIEGIEENDLYNDHEINGINPNAIRGFLLSIALKHKIPIIFTKNEEDTAKFIQVIAKKQKKEEISLKVKKISLNKKEQLQFILEGFPGIGPKTSQKLLKEFKTLKQIINTPLEDIKKIIGKKSEIFRLLEERY